MFVTVISALVSHAILVLVWTLYLPCLNVSWAARLDLRRLQLSTGARQLSTLGTRLAAIVRSGDRAPLTIAPIQLQLCTACQLAESLFRFTTETGMHGAVQALLGCVTLPLECGRTLMAVPGASSFGGAELAITLLDSQAVLLLDISMSPGNAAGAQLGSPEPLLAWLSAAASRVLALNGTSLGRGSARTLQLRLSFFVCSILDKPPSSLAAALQLEASLLRKLVQLLLPPLHAAAAAMQLPADRRPSELSWSLVSSITRGLRSETLSQAFKEQQAVATTGDSSYAPRMLQTTAQLFAAAPGSCPDTFVGDNERAGLWLSLLWLLNVGTCLVRSRAQPQASGAALPEALRQQMARQLLQALRRLPTALQVVAEHAARQADSGLAAGVLILANTIPQEFHQLASPSASDRQLAAAPDLDYSIVGSLADVSACCAAASAMVRALPHVAALEGLAQPEQSDAAAADLYSPGQLAMSLMVPTSGLASAVHHYCQGMEGRCSAADATAATKALWQLHTTLCRGIYTSAAGLNVAKKHIEVLLTGLACYMDAFVHVQAAQQGRAASSDADVCDSKPRQAESGHSRVLTGSPFVRLTYAQLLALLHRAPFRLTSALLCCMANLCSNLLAMSVAQVEAVLGSAASQPRPADEVLAFTLLHAIEFGPAALASSPAVQQALDALIEQLGVANEGFSEGIEDAADLADQLAALPRREPQAGDALELAQAAATRSCAYLRCANLAGEGGPAAGQGAGSQRCSKCKVAWYCGTACSHADWRAGHRRVCRALGAARVAERA
ncbi:hypothetical protein ACK3TF_000754 [Chlorella vulgaris]